MMARNLEGHAVGPTSAQSTPLSRRSVESDDARPLMAVENSVPMPVAGAGQTSFNMEDGAQSPAAHWSQRPQPQRSLSNWLFEEAVAAGSIIGLAFSCFIYNAIFLAHVLPAEGKQQWVQPLAISFNVLWILTIWSYLQAHVQSPGTIPQRWKDFVEAVGDTLVVAQPRREFQPGYATFCRPCMMLRPERAHHCSICQVCVLRYDHHCPFVKNCIGFRNHKFFILLLVYGMLVSWWGLMTTLPEMTRFMVAFLRLKRGDPWTEPVSMTSAGLVLAFDLVAMCFAALFPTMAFAHVPLAMSNRTTIESTFRNAQNPYYMGSTIANLTQLFGKPGLDWLLPIFPCSPVDDGVSFMRSDVQRSEAHRAWEEDEDSERKWQVRYHVSLHGKRQQQRLDGCVGCFH